jgi:hypothetical protein
MRIKVTKPFEWSPDGAATQKVKSGDIVEGPIADAVMQAGAGEPAPEEDEKTRPNFDDREPTEPVADMYKREMNDPPGSAKSVPNAPQNKAVTTAATRKK